MHWPRGEHSFGFALAVTKAHGSPIASDRSLITTGQNDCDGMIPGYLSGVDGCPAELRKIPGNDQWLPAVDAQ